ncbi:kinase-like domain-containing protein [Sporodiniella umbellata]|nr:kinase-like domain-containing protein [Sporodiniella umbellata]
MSNALLLRLFTSEFFNAWIAISYLFRYSDNVGIQHYLCAELKKFPVSEVEFFLPQLMHLMITQPLESVALECLMMDVCEQSTHTAIMSLWYLQAYLSDLSARPKDASFELCKRVLNKCQGIVFSDIATVRYSPNGKVKENVLPTLIGLGAMLAGIGQPLLTRQVGPIAIAQGRRHHPTVLSQEALARRNTTDRSATRPSLADRPKRPTLDLAQYQPHSQPKLKTVHSDHTRGLVKYLRTKRKPEPPLDSHWQLLGQSSVPADRPIEPDTASVHSLEAPNPHRTLLKSNYFRSQIQFVLTLVDIAARLVIVPKEARMSALHAELTLLNHNLPADICLPLWCSGKQQQHHQLVRICPSDAVVLNSAERAPYLLMLEVLEEDDRLEEEELPPLPRPTLTPSTPCRNPKHTDDYADRMRTAAVMLTQLQGGIYSQATETIRQKIIQEMNLLEEQRLEKMKTKGVDHIEPIPSLLEDEQHIAWVVNKEDPSAAILSEHWETKKERLRAASPYGHLRNWQLVSVIVKHGSDLRQEQFAVQLIREMQRIWKDTQVDVWVKYFRVMVTSDSSGLIETLKNTVSIHSIKKEAYTRGWNREGTLFTLYNYFEKTWGPPDSNEFIKAQDAFMRSLAGYSIVCYILQIKDRHNGNLLMDHSGHLIHIDFGFMLSNSPGSVGFEMAPFKLPQDYVDILGGVHSEKFAEYKALMKAAFLAIRKHSENILLLTEMMSKDSRLPCFQYGELTVSHLRDRFQLQLTEPQAEEWVDKLIMSSYCNVFTRLYDTFQYYSQGIL